jgi:hypothetical protein
MEVKASFADESREGKADHAKSVYDQDREIHNT